VICHSRPARDKQTAEGWQAVRIQHSQTPTTTTTTTEPEGQCIYA
jgi:hypothetical protein